MSESSYQTNKRQVYATSIIMTQGMKKRLHFFKVVQNQTALGNQSAKPQRIGVSGVDAGLP